MSEFNVAIIGAGVHGASAAYHLAEAGGRVVVLEAGTPAGGPTGRSSAICRAYYTNEFLARVARESMDFFASFAERTGGRECGLVQTGELYLHPAEEEAEVHRTVERLNAIGTECAYLSAAEIAERHPSFELEGIACAAWEPGAGYADPAGTTTGLLAAAVDRGVTVRSREQVREIALDGGGVTLTTSEGSVTAEKLLIAAGPWTKALAAQLGADLPLTVERHLVATYDWAGAEPLPLVLADVPNGYYLKPEGHEQFFLGSLWEEPNVDPDDYAEEIAAEESADLIERVIRRVPGLSESAARGGWASLYDVSPDWQPVIGEIAEHVFVDAGTSGHGFKLAPALGRHVADLVLGRGTPEMEQFAPSRFAGGTVLTSAYESARIIG